MSFFSSGGLFGLAKAPRRLATTGAALRSQLVTVEDFLDSKRAILADVGGATPQAAPGGAPVPGQAVPQDNLAGLPPGSVDNGDGTFTLPHGKVWRRH